MGSTPAPPPAPDPREIAQTDAEFNRIDQVTPFGSLTYGGPNRNQATLELSPELQANTDLRLQSDSQLLQSALERQGLLNQNPIDISRFGDIQSQLDLSNVNFQGPQFSGLPNLQAPNIQGVNGNVNLQGQVNAPFDIQNQVNTNVDTSGLPQIPQDIQRFRGDVEQAVFDRGRALLDPVFSDQERAMEQRLANQGLPNSGEAVDRDVNRFQQNRARAFTDLANQATITGGSEASRALGDVLAAQGQGFGQGAQQAGLNLAGGQFANQAAGQGFNQNLAQAGFGNQAQLQGLEAQLAGQGFNNQAGLLGLGANQGIRGQLTGEQLAQNQAQNQASSANLGLQQQILNNQNQARAQSLAEQQGIRGNQFNELASLLGLQQVQAPGLDSFYSPGQANVTGAFGLEQQALQNNYQNQLANQSANLGGLFGLGGSILGGPIGGGLMGLFGGGQTQGQGFTSGFGGYNPFG